MKIRTKSIPTSIDKWSAINDDSYDGAPDSRNRSHIGYGLTKADAVADLIYREFCDGDLKYLDAIEELQKHGYTPKEAEQLVAEWADGLESEEDVR